MIFHPGMKSISGYLDGSLPEKRRERIRRHLDSCNSCRKEVQLLQSPSIELKPQSELMEQISTNVMKSLIEPSWNEASDIIGEVEAITGEAFINNRTLQRTTQAVPGFALHKNDILLTSETGKVLVRLNDGSYLYINKRTEIDFSNKRHNLFLERGELFAMMKPQPDKFRIKTPTAALTVIGTDFDTIVTDANQTLLKVFKGSVNFESNLGEVLVKSKYQATTEKSGKPAVTRIKNDKSSSSWTGSLMSDGGSGGNKGSGFKKIIAALLTVILIAGAWYFFKPLASPKDSRNGSGGSSFRDRSAPFRVEIGLNKYLEDVYGLEDGIILKHIKPPFDPSREEFFRPQAENYTGETARAMYIADEQGNLKMQGSTYGGDPDIKTIISIIIRFDRNYVEGDSSILRKTVPGDYVYSATATSEEKLSVLSELLSSELGYRISLDIRNVPREIYFAGGRLNFQPGKTGGREIMLIPPSGDTSNMYSMSSSLRDILRQIERMLNIRIKTDGTIDPNRIIGLKLEAGEITQNDVNYYLEQFTEQTGITFTKVMSPVRILFVEKSGDSYTGNLERFLESMESMKPDLTYKQKDDLTEFADAYSLSNSENFKAIKDISSHGRKAFFDVQNVGMRYADISTFILRWKDGMPEMRAMMYDPIQFRTLIGFITVLPHYEIDGDEDILSTKLEGDLLYREFETMDEKLRMLEEYYEKEFDSKIRIGFREADKKAVVGSGQFKLNPVNQGSDMILVKSGRFTTKRTMTGTFDDLIQTGSDLYEFRFINEIDNPPAEVKWKIDYDQALFDKGYEYYLEQVSQQTGIKFTEEDRPMQVLFISRE